MLVSCYNAIKCLLGILHKITKGINLMLLFVTYIVVTCTYREYFWKATHKELVILLPPEQPMSGTHLRNRDWRLPTFVPSKSYTSECIPNCKNK